MSRNAGKVRCTHLTRGGRPCRGWAVRGSYPPTCSSHLSAVESARTLEQARPSHFHAHAPQAVPERACSVPPVAAEQAGSRPSGLKQACTDPAERVESFYTPVLSRQELADLVTYAAEMTLADEIACARAAVRRTLEFLSRGPDAVSESNYLRAVGLVHQGTRAIAQLLRDQQALGGSVSDQLQAIIDAALDDLGEEWGVEL